MTPCLQNQLNTLLFCNFHCAGKQGIDAKVHLLLLLLAISLHWHRIAAKQLQRKQLARTFAMYASSSCSSRPFRPSSCPVRLVWHALSAVVGPPPVLASA
jgi:hypothetical protein